MAKKKSEPETGLDYVGNGLIIPGVPPRGLEHQEVLHYSDYETLIGSGLYKLRKAPSKDKN